MNTVFLNGQSNIGQSGCVMLLGGFDGLHVGHKKLLARAKTYGLPIGIMTIFGERRGAPLFTLDERRKIFCALGFAFVCEMEFAQIKDVTATAFAQMLQEEYNVKAFICGDDFRFGKGANGTPETLQGVEDAEVCVEEILTLEGEKISSSSVKNALDSGNVARAQALLGERFFLLGRVEQDRKVGRTLGFPTANIAYPQGKYALKVGVYETRVDVGGETYKGITNYGARPTFGDGQVWTETYLDGFSGDLYGKTLQVQFVRFLRDVRRFESADALKAQLTEDIRRVRDND